MIMVEPVSQSLRSVWPAFHENKWAHISWNDWFLATAAVRFLMLSIFCLSCLTAPSRADGSSHQDILYFGDVPVLLRLYLVVDGKPWSETRRELARRHFHLLDTDSDHLLTVEQVEGLPLPGFQPSDSTQWDTEEDDGKLSELEFLRVFERHGQPAFFLAEGDSQAASRIRLFPHLDTNKDGKLTESEFAQARLHLARLDYDDDETISTTELAPFTNPLFQQGVVGRETPLANTAPFVSVGSFKSTADLAAALLKRYSAEDGSDGEGERLTCQPKDLGSTQELTQYDQDGDGLLDHVEVTRYLEQRQPDVTLQIELPLQRASRPKIKLLADEIGASRKRPSRIRGSSRLALAAGQTGLDLRVQSSLAKISDNRNFYLAEFRRADQDQNAYLDATEFGIVGLDVPLGRIDLNGDEKIERAEMVAYLDRDAFTSQSQLVMSVAADTRTLFSVIDRNADQRLTIREFKEIGERLQYLDGNRDGTIETNEIAHEYRLLFSMGRPRVFQQAMSMQQNRNAPAPRATPSTAAPDWFRKMDRNQDGDLSWREFLGRRVIFDKLDQDQDGLITVTELK